MNLFIVKIKNTSETYLFTSEYYFYFCLIKQIHEQTTQNIGLCKTVLALCQP